MPVSDMHKLCGRQITRGRHRHSVTAERKKPPVCSTCWSLYYMGTALHTHVCFWYRPVFNINHITCIQRSFTFCLKCISCICIHSDLMCMLQAIWQDPLLKIIGKPWQFLNSFIFKIDVFWDEMPRSLVEIYHLRRTCCLWIHDRKMIHATWWCR